jgi:transcriptional regulator with PAS, ATPase and Fis domain
MPAPKAPRRLSELGALRVVDAERWAKQVRQAMNRNAGRVPDAANELGVSPRTLFRWLAEDRLLKDVERAAPSLHRDE